ncbi:CPBP family intramembrane glutamic endopeptidase [Fodinicola acaciae]|uniref:CPBP family intramembrane glutamic endopeptidase n=1 Tax=Fodinicola acaciae TaxID=2681555 RepID=UPI0013D2800B|nr:type II CAAX endopeptidase family protein [Fodinicola acaciae]
MADVRGFVRSRPLICFFVLACGLSWLAWIPYVLSETGLGIWHFRFPEFLGTTQLAGVLPGAYLGPITAAALVTALADGRAGIRVWVGRLLRWKVSWRWYAGVLLGVPAVIVLFSTALADGKVVAPPAAVLIAYVPGLLLQMITTGLAEEPGWRDFAQPRLQQKYGPLAAAFILGPIWGVWHLPLFFSEWGDWPHVTVLGIVEFVAATTALSIVMAWVFNRTGESLPLAMLLHVSINNFFSIVWSSMYPTLTKDDVGHVMLLACAVVAVIVLVATRGRLGLPKTLARKAMQDQL